MGLKEKLIRQRAVIAHKINIYNEIVEDETSHGFAQKMKVARRIQAILINTLNDNSK